jgi:hypothetical protein
VKRVLLLLIVAMLVLVPAFASSDVTDISVESSCNHVWGHKGTVLSDYCHVIDDFKHNNQYADKYQCVLCFREELRLIPGYFLEEDHSKHYWDEHIPGTQVHRETETCLKCSWRKERDYFCPGPPCIMSP